MCVSWQIIKKGAAAKCDVTLGEDGARKWHLSVPDDGRGSLFKLALALLAASGSLCEEEPAVVCLGQRRPPSPEVVTIASDEPAAGRVEVARLPEPAQPAQRKAQASTEASDVPLSVSI